MTGNSAAGLKPQLERPPRFKFRDHAMPGGGGAGPRGRAEITAIKKIGGSLTKKFELINGELDKSSADCWMSEGEMEPVLVLRSCGVRRQTKKQSGSRAWATERP